jgi:hypothetical protein
MISWGASVFNGKVVFVYPSDAAVAQHLIGLDLLAPNPGLKPSVRDIVLQSAATRERALIGALTIHASQCAAIV